MKRCNEALSAAREETGNSDKAEASSSHAPACIKPSKVRGREDQNLERLHEHSKPEKAHHQSLEQPPQHG